MAHSAPNVGDAITISELCLPILKVSVVKIHGFDCTHKAWHVEIAVPNRDPEAMPKSSCWIQYRSIISHWVIYDMNTPLPE